MATPASSTAETLPLNVLLIQAYLSSMINADRALGPNGAKERTETESPRGGCLRSWPFCDVDRLHSAV